MFEHGENRLADFRRSANLDCQGALEWNMPTTTKKKSKSRKSAAKKSAAKKSNRCWPGYEPVKGKKEHEQGSCRPKAKSKLSSGEKTFRKKRRKQLDKWEAQHPHTRKSASQHLGPPTTRKRAA